MKLEDIKEASNETLSERKDELYADFKETFGVPDDILGELCEVERELTLRETG